MFIDFVPVMLINLVVALVLYAVYVVFFVHKEPRRLAPGFLAVGLIALTTGFHMIFVWPLPSSYNIAFGELSVMLGALYFFAGLAVALGWDLLSIGIYAVFAGLASVVIGIRVLNLGMTTEPPLASSGFILTGVAAILALPSVTLTKAKALHWVAAVIAAAGAVIWAITGYGAYWGHLQSFLKYAPR
jgi:putative membrane protein